VLIRGSWAADRFADRLRIRENRNSAHLSFVITVEGAHDGAGDSTMRIGMAFAREASFDEQYGRLRRVAGPLVLVGAALVMLVACAAPVTPTASPPTPVATVSPSASASLVTTPTPVVTPAATSAASPTPSAASAAPSNEPSGSPVPGDPKVFGRISGVDSQVRAVTVDLCEWFFGDAAIQAARDDGVGTAASLSNGFYVRDFHMRRTYTVDAKAPIIVLGWGSDGDTKMIQVNQAEYFMNWRDGHWSNRDPLPPGAWTSAVYYWLDTTPDGVVTRIEAQYVP
jgi:hypothetical protein